MRVRRLIGVGCEQATALQPVFEGKIDDRTFGLKSGAGRIWLRQWPPDLGAVLIKDEDVGSERVLRVEIAGPKRALLVADTRQPVPGFEHEHLEPLAIAEKRDAGRSIQARGEDRNLEPRRNGDVLPVARREQSGCAWG